MNSPALPPVPPMHSGRVPPVIPAGGGQIPDLAEAVTFLRFMCGDQGTVFFRTFTDDARKKAHDRGRNSSAPLPITESALVPLAEENKRRRGIFWVVNEGGQKAADITRMRALFADYDGPEKSDGLTLEQFMQRLERLPPPHAIVESSPGKRHVYWRVEGVPTSQFRQFQEGIATQLGSDCLKDLSRVLRVPGFVHAKEHPFRVCTLALRHDLPPYSEEQARQFAMTGGTQSAPRPPVPPMMRLPAVTAQGQATNVIQFPYGAPFDFVAAFADAPDMHGREGEWGEPDYELPALPAAQAHQYDRECVFGALAHLATAGFATDHENWQRIGACLRGCTRPGERAGQAVLTDAEALQQFDRFSQQARNYDAEDVQARWPTLGDMIHGPGALLAAAKAVGWQQTPRPKSPQTAAATATVSAMRTAAMQERKAQKLAGAAQMHGEWVKLLDRRADGEPYSHILNAATALRHAPHFAGSLAFDELANEIVVVRAFTPGAIAFPAGAVRLDDGLLSCLMLNLNQVGLRSISADTAMRAADLVGKQNSYHPVKQYLGALRWDGQARLAGWLTTYLGVSADQYSATVGRWWMISAVARVMRPGCKVDHMLVLTGRQGAGKSTALRTLAGGSWFTDNLPSDLGNLAAVGMALRGVWIAELAELASMRRSEIEAVKHFISRQRERYRPPYGRCEVIEDRQTVLAGSTNEDSFLADATGSRRFWPVAVGRIDLGALARDRDQLWAEACHAFAGGEIWWPDREFEANVIRPHQQAAELVDEWGDLLATKLPLVEARERESGKPFMASLEQIAFTIGLDAARLTPYDGQRLARLLKTMGFAQVRSRGVRYWRR